MAESVSLSSASEQAETTAGASLYDTAIASFALVLAWAVMAWPWLSGRVTIPWDAKAHFLPQLQFLSTSIASGESPFWLPYAFSGHPQIADPQSLIFSPPFLALAALDPQPTAWAADVTLFLLILASGFALMRWLMDRGQHAAAALLAALSFMFGAAMAWRIQHVGQVMSLAYLPFVLLCMDRALDRRSVVYGMAAGVAAALLVLGRDQVALLAIYFLIAYVATRVISGRDVRAMLRDCGAPLAAAAITGLLLIALPLVMTALVAADSNRPSIDLEGAGRGSLHPALALTLFSADVFGSSGAYGDYWGPPSARWSTTGLYIAQNMGQMYFGALPVLLLIIGFASGLLLSRKFLIFSVTLAVAALYGLGWYTPAFAAMHGMLPGVDLFRRPADAVFLIGFLGSVLAAISLDHALRARLAVRRRTVGITVAFIAAAFATMIALAVHFESFTTHWPAIAVAAALCAISALALVVVARRPQSSAVTIGIVAALLTADLAWSNGPGGATGLPANVYDVLEPDTGNPTIAALKRLTSAGRSETRRDRIELVGFGFHWPNASVTHSLENTLGYNPLRLGAYSKATGAGDHVGLIEQKQFSPLFPSYRATLPDMLGLRYIATSAPIETIDKRLAPGALPLAERTADGFIYENAQAWPRVVFASAAEAADFKTVAATGTWPPGNRQNTVLLEGPLATAAPKAPGRAAITTYHNTSVIIEADSPDGGWVVLNDLWHPWWFATRDGQPAKIEKANVLFRAVEVPPGHHTITMTFEPVRGALDQLRGELSR